MSEAHSRSRSGWLLRRASISATTSPAPPRSSCAASRSSTRPRRASSSRTRYGTTHSPSPASGRTSPWNIASAVVQSARAAAGSLESRGRCLAGQAENLDRVDCLGRNVERVAGSRPGDQRAVTERASEPRDLGLQRVAGDAHRLVRPEILDQPLGSHHDPGFEREPDEQLGRLAGPHGDCDAVAVQLDRAEHRDRDHTAPYDARPVTAP